MTLDGGNMVMIYELTSPYTVGIKSPLIKVIFNTNTALGATDDACVMWLKEPYCQITIQQIYLIKLSSSPFFSNTLNSS